jgi:hypothetical protein
VSTVSRTTSFTTEHNGVREHGEATFRFDDNYPTDVTVSFTGDGCRDSVTWIIGRDVLAQRVEGLSAVRCRAEGLWFHIDLSSHDGTGTVTLVRAQVDAFLRATERLVPYGAERIDVDAGIAQLLGGAR